MARLLGTVQGRLMEAPKGKLQWINNQKWDSEFKLLKPVKLNFIEMFIDEDWDKKNPLVDEKKILKLKSLLLLKKIKIKSVCFDNIIKTNFCLDNEKSKIKNKISELQQIGFKKFILPCLGESELKFNSSQSLAIIEMLKIINEGNVLLIEAISNTDLLINYIEQFKSDKIKILYDTGNVAPYGNISSEDILKIGKKRLGHLHVKDKDSLKNNVRIGTGLVDFKSTFSALNLIDYDDDIVFETIRGINPIETMKYNIEYIKQMGCRI